MKKSKAIDFVDVFIGTAGSTHALVGPQMPHGMVKLGPDTVRLPCAGYDYSDKRMLGFSHTHLEGCGARGGRGNIMLMASTGPLCVEEKAYSSSFSHERESGGVGYYQVLLEDYGIRVELTAAAHTGFHRYAFPPAGQVRILLDIGHSLNVYNNCLDGHVEITGDTTAQGYGTYPVEEPGSPPLTVYFNLEFDRPFDSFGVWDHDKVMDSAFSAQGCKVGAYFSYSAGDGLCVQVKVGISYISCLQALENRQRDIPHWRFETVRKQCEEAWEEILGRVAVQDRDKTAKRIFYSALYRSLNQPADYSEYGHYHSGFSGSAKVYPSEGRRFFLDDWALWDTFRTTHPLQSIVEPEIGDDMVNTLAGICKDGGWLPTCSAPSLGYVQNMIGHNAVSVITEYYLKGKRDFDVGEAYRAIWKTATSQDENPALRRLGTPVNYRENGYCPGGGEEDTPEDRFSVSLTLEYAYADWCAAQMAKAAGKEEDHALFMERAGNYRNLFDFDLGFMRPRHSDGSWVEPFNPADSFKNGFCECTSWEYSFFVPHDVQGLINLMGGRAAFIRKLDGFFMGGHFNYQNETSLQVPYLYSFAGAPWRTAEVMRKYMGETYKARPAGSHGEDDAGAMSAWYVLGAMGIYPVCPAQGTYVIASPLFRKLSISLPDGKTFSVRAENLSSRNICIQSARYGGVPWSKCFITHEEIFNGGELELQMGSEPGSAWGTGQEDVPPSMTRDLPEMVITGLSADKGEVMAGEAFILSVGVTNEGADGGDEVVIRAGSRIIASATVKLRSMEHAEISVPAVIYNEGAHEIEAGLCKTEIRVRGFTPACFEYALPEWSCICSIRPSGKKETVSAIIRNTGGKAGTAKVPLLVNGVVAASRNIRIKPGESRKVRFSLGMEEIGAYMIQIGESGAVPHYVAGAVDKQRYAPRSTTFRMDCRQAGENILIRADGFEDTAEFGMVFLKDKVIGDFTAIARVTHEELSSPYAPAAIAVMSRLPDASDPFSMLQGYYVMAGAMSKRAYFFRAADDQAHASYGNVWMGCPEPPYWFRIVRKGNLFDASYGLDGIDWVSLGSAEIPGALESHHVCVLNQSAIPEMRLVIFDNFSVIPERSKPE